MAEQRREHLEFYDVQVDVPVPEGGWQPNTWYHVYLAAGLVEARTELLPPAINTVRVGTFRTKSDGAVRRFKVDDAGHYTWKERASA